MKLLIVIVSVIITVTAKTKAINQKLAKLEHHLVDLEQQDMVEKEELKKEMHNPKQDKLELVDLEQQNMVEKEELNQEIVNLTLKMKDLKNPLKQKFANLKQQIMVEKEDLKQEMINLQQKLVKMNNDNLELKLKIEDLSNPPFYHMCLFQDHGYGNNHVINYDRILYHSSYRCDDADIDLNSGLFTAGFSGTYTVTWSLRAKNYWRNRIYLRKNKTQMKESCLESYSQRDNHQFDQGKFLL